MGAHASHITHVNSIRAWVEVPISARETEVLEIYRRATAPLTDRQVAKALRRADLNYVRPTITRLLQRRLLEPRESIVDPETSRSVRTVRIIPRLADSSQGELF